MSTLASEAFLRSRAAIAAAGAIHAPLLGLKRPSLGEVADRTLVVAKGGTMPIRRAFMPERHERRIEVMHFTGAKPAEIIPDMLRDELSYPDMLAHELKGAVLFGSSLYCGRARHFLGGDSGRWGRLMSGGVVDRRQEVALSTTMWGSVYWANLLYEDLPLQMAAAEFGEVVSHERAEYCHEGAYREWFGLARPREFRVLSARKWVFLEDNGVSRHKLGRLRAMRRRAEGVAPTGKRVYIRRGAGGEKRTLVNEEALLGRLEAEGFVVVDTAHDSAEKVMAALLGAAVVMGVEGSHLAPAVFLAATGALFLVLFPPRRVLPVMTHVAAACGLRVGLAVCEGVSDEVGEFSIEADDLLGFIGDAERHFERDRVAVG